jgi:hypothetical protein
MAGRQQLLSHNGCKQPLHVSEIVRLRSQSIDTNKRIFCNYLHFVKPEVLKMTNVVETRRVAENEKPVLVRS